MLAPYEAGNESAWVASFRFFVDVRPRYHECDGQGHVSNVVYTSYLELSRLQYFGAAHDPEPLRSFPYQHVTAELQLRYMAACYYDEPLRIGSKLVALGRSSATLEQVIAGLGAADIRGLARVTLVRANPNGAGPAPWTNAQRAALTSFSGLG